MATTKSKLITPKLVLLVLGATVIFLVYKITIGANVKIQADTYFFYVPEVSSAEEVSDTLKKRGFLRSRISFKIMAYCLELSSIKPGMYELKKGWNNYELIQHFKVHKPKPTVFSSIPTSRSRHFVVSTICKGTSIHPDDLWKIINNRKFNKELGGFTKESIFSIFLPRNYRFYKKYSAEDLMKRMHQEYLLFWNESRLQKANDMGLTPQEVYIIASIVYSETKRVDEMPLIAGVYLNRIQKNMRLESDPTLLFAGEKMNAKRVHFKDKGIDSPYNTYKYRGLPPGPICIMPTSVIDAVLSYEGHDYLYFCANHDLSGTHLFAETFEEHKENAQRYRKKLNEENIH